MSIIQAKGELPQRHKDDFYETPQSFCHAAIQLLNDIYELEGFGTDLHIVDVGAGTGHWGLAAKCYAPLAYLTGVEVNPDFIQPNYYDEWLNMPFENYQPETDGKSLVFIGNPPYYNNGIERFVKQCLDYDRTMNIAFLAKLRWLESLRRYNSIFSQHPFSKMFVSPHRLSFYKGAKSSTNDEGYAFYIWDKPRVMMSPTVGWLSWR